MDKFELSFAVSDAIQNNRRWGHSHVMAAFPPGLGVNPRAQLKLLWHLDANTRLMTVQSETAAKTPELLGARVGSVAQVGAEAGAELTLRITLSCQKTPPSQVPDVLRPLLKQGPDAKSYRSRMVIVPPVERSVWAAKRLAAIGFEATSVQLSDVYFASLGVHGKAIPAVDLVSFGVVRDADRFAEARREGVGKGKNYGLGLIRIEASA
ncbi:hypothetical protein GCM10022198_06220 [Klugiella xanthotipulae]|uniref:CRISPR-associated protein Cse3 family n=2 Tax=Klugiella xanthotipulae TaxID=244735 RepID=A0A543I687_9MICO|nr:type I-E CRISPR-associated protein Cas6/Cse3/CasE [Klugiella xanthotipulae]TQM65990.1 CRISPR-associated protein Cse3 family [Klugiella xanthotipulae]